MTHLFFEDFAVGDTLPGAEMTVSSEDARRFVATFGDIGTTFDIGAVSGLYVSALAMRLICDAFLHRTASLGAPGIDTVDWPHPVLVGDTLRLRARVTSTRASRSRPTMGLVGFEFTLFSQSGNVVMTQSNVILVERRGGEVEE